MGEVPASMIDRGPVPGTVIVSLVAEEDIAENHIVTFGATESSCKLCGSTDVPLGWAQGNVLEDAMASIHLYAPMWKGHVCADSDPIAYGDAIEMAGSGNIRRAQPDSGNSIFGYAMLDGEGDGYILMVYNCCATATPYVS